MRTQVQLWLSWRQKKKENRKKKLKSNKNNITHVISNKIIMINTLSHILFFCFLESMASIYTLECPFLYNELIFFLFIEICTFYFKLFNYV